MFSVAPTYLLCVHCFVQSLSSMLSNKTHFTIPFDLKKYNYQFLFYRLGFSDSYLAILIIKDPNFVLSLGRHIIILRLSLITCHDAVHFPRLSLIKHLQHFSAPYQISCHLLFSQSMRHSETIKFLHLQMVMQNRTNK